MTGTAPEPFLLLEPEAAPRLEAAPAIILPAEPVLRLGSPALAGATIIGLGLPLLWGVWLVTALFNRWATLGWIGLVVLVAGLCLICIGIGRELRGLAGLRRVDHLRAEFASGEAQRVEKAARRWLQALPQHAAILPALTASETPEAMLALLRAGPAQIHVAFC
ncbi:MAG: putative rane protein [Acetobacteraceae bacterium]|nr:putative rane protein [Acetobacteraceae bacterium]